MLLVFITGSVFLVNTVMLSEPLSSKKYHLRPLPSMRDAGQLNRQLLRDSWQWILPLAP